MPEINFYDPKSPIDLTDEFLLQETGGGAYKKTLYSTIYNNLYNALLTVGNPIGTIIMHGGSSAPDNYLLCDGSAISRSTYSGLFGIIGTTYGAGDTTTTFNLPNYQGVVPKGAGSQTINTRSKTGPDLGVVEEDALQGFAIKRGASNYNSGAAPSNFNDADAFAPGCSLATYSETNITGCIQPDGTNGTPRLSTTTRENSIGTNFYIKYQ